MQEEGVADGAIEDAVDDVGERFTLLWKAGGLA